MSYSPWGCMDMNERLNSRSSSRGNGTSNLSCSDRIRVCGNREGIVWVYSHGQTTPEKHFNQWAQLNYSINGSDLGKK